MTIQSIFFYCTAKLCIRVGINLSFSHDIVKAHGGELKVETKEGEGATFAIQLPVS